MGLYAKKSLWLHNTRHYTAETQIFFFNKLKNIGMKDGQLSIMVKQTFTEATHILKLVHKEISPEKLKV